MLFQNKLEIRRLGDDALKETSRGSLNTLMESCEPEY